MKPDSKAGKNRKDARRQVRISGRNTDRDGNGVAEVSKIREGQDFEFVVQGEIKVDETRNFAGDF